MAKFSVKDQSEPLHHSAPQKQSWLLWEGWVGAMALAELTGLGIVFIAGVLIDRWGTESAAVVFHIAGFLEGIVLGVAQWLVLHRYVKHIGAWIIVTTIAAMIAWLIGLQLAALMIFAITLNTGLTATMKAGALFRGVFLLGAWVGGVLGLAQWFVLKSHIRQAALWITANAIAWASGLLVAVTLIGHISFDRISFETAFTGIVTGLTTGAAIGAITGVALIWLLQPHAQQN